MLVVEQDEAEIRAPVHQAVMWGVVVVGMAPSWSSSRPSSPPVSHSTDRPRQQGAGRPLERPASLGQASLAGRTVDRAGSRDQQPAGHHPVGTDEHRRPGAAASGRASRPAGDAGECGAVQRQVERCGGITAKMLQFGRTREPRIQPTDVNPRLEENRRSDAEAGAFEEREPSSRRSPICRRSC